MTSQKPIASLWPLLFVFVCLSWDCSTPLKPKREGATTLQDGSIPTIPESKEDSAQDDGGLRDKERILEDKDPTNRDGTPQEPGEVTPNSEHQESTNESSVPNPENKTPKSTPDNPPMNSSWVKDIDSLSYSEGYDVAVDTKGNIYVTGYFDRHAIFGNTTLTAQNKTQLHGYYDIYVAKLSPNGKWLWAKRAGGYGNDDRGRSIAVDNKGDILITGQFEQRANFGPFSLVAPKYKQAFVAKLNTSGKWLWAKRIESTELSVGYALTVDTHNNILITGHFYKTANFGKTTLTARVRWEIFVAKMDPNGQWLWAKRAGGPKSVNKVYKVTTDTKGNVILTGQFNKTVQFGTIQIHPKAPWELFVAKLDKNGKWLWAKRGGGSTGTSSNFVGTVDAQGNIFVAGQFNGKAEFGTMTFTPRQGGKAGPDIDIFVAKLDTNGKWLWVKRTFGTLKYPGGYNSSNESRGIAVSTSGSVYITGRFEETTIFGNTTLKTNSDTDIFVAKLDTNGKWLWAKQAGSTQSSDKGNSIVVDKKGNIITTGLFACPAKFGGIKVTKQDSNEAFVWKLKP